jgi:hypothetical protein
MLPLLGSFRFHDLFHSPAEVLFTFPSRYFSTIGHLRVFSLTRWSSQIHTGFHVSHITRESYIIQTNEFLQDFHLLWSRTQLVQNFLFVFLAYAIYVPQPENKFSFRLVPFRSPLLWESLLLFFPLATKMFQFTRLSLNIINVQFMRLPHSGIFGSMRDSSSPKRFVGIYALHRLEMPRYSPEAFNFLNTVNSLSQFIILEVSGLEPLASALQRQRSTN